MNTHATLDELEKLGAVSPQQARTSLDRLDTLEQNKPTSGQVARYAGLGAVTAPAVGMLSNAIRKKPVFEGLRGVAADATKGAIGMGAMPLLRGHLDRQAEIGTLKKYLHENGTPNA